MAQPLDIAETLQLLSNIDTQTLQLLQQIQNLQKKNELIASTEQPPATATSTLKNIDKLYDESWIVLQNRLLNAITNLDLNERRLVMFLSPIVRKAVDKNPNQRKFVIRVKDFIDEYKINSHSYYKELKKIGRGLQDKSFVFWDFNQNTKESLESAVSWIGKSTYKPKLGEIEIVLMDDVVEMLTVFDKANPYTKYQRDMIVSLGCYGLLMFELIASCMYQKHKTRAYTIEYLREKFNCQENYEKISDFKLYVIDKAIKDVEANTPYRVTYTQNKSGRRISELVFSFEDISVKNLAQTPNQLNQQNSIPKGNIKQRTSWQVKGLSDAQIKKLAIYQKEFIDANTSKMSPNDRRDYPDIFEDWKPMLKDPKQVNTFHKIQELLDRKKT
ncbi:initiator RepB protein [Enhydrobacter aerosaccus SK60]|nr:MULTISPECIES: replication initiation protein [Moraxella]EEV23400.1 initiator RepB protein [Enhydrobacter aerosaccus SK60]MBL7668833.1 replication initiation protein [Moraxella osloensis]NOX77429.1 replication initiation protein [Gammaproteobacteria bacterium]NPA78247.1 replication initiation protein [Gammaproteobacteria bacterium]